ncbi:MAG: endo alpha-1,4 polygalactosaminidase [Granulosicoccus sp.]
MICLRAFNQSVVAPVRQKVLKAGMRAWRVAGGALLGVLLSFVAGCSTVDRVEQVSGDAQTIPVYSQQSWYLSDLANNTSASSAPGTLSALLQTHLHARGVSSVKVAQGTQRIQIEGELLSWHYQHVAALRPYVDMRIDVRDTSRNIIIRSDRLSKQGARSESLTTLADRLLATYVRSLPLQKQTDTMNDLIVQKSTPDYLKTTAASQTLTAATLGLRTSTNANVPSGSFDTVQGVDNLAGRSVAFYYGANPAIDELSQFDRIILEPDNIDKRQLRELQSQGATAYGYVSVGEVGKHRSYAKQLHSDWIIGSNPAWQSAVLDLANVELRRFLVKRVGDLVQQGYQGIFLDTMDSFNIVAKTDEQKQIQREGLVQLVTEFANTYPQLSIFTNRGFEVLDDISTHIDAVVAESLYAGWNNEQQRYVEIAEPDRQWLLSKLEHAANRLDLEVVVVDYVPPVERDKARKVAARIAKHGFIPWVANPAFDYLGIGAMEVFPRKVLMLYDSAEEGIMKNSFVHRYAAMPIEYFGYVPEYLDVSADPLPEGVLKGRYAGIVTWTRKDYPIAGFRPWLYRQMQDQVPVAFLGSLPLAMDNTLANLMGVSTGSILEERTAKLVLSDEMVNPERKLFPRVDDMRVTVKNQDADSRVHMRYRDAAGTVADVVLTGKFGGFAFNPGAIQNGLDYSAYWVVDPFEFLETALQLPRIPQPDVTSENGRRLWLAHIDGDALPSWAEMPGKRLGADVIYDEILSQYNLPHTVSVVEGEITGFVKFADRLKQMFDIARRSFALEHVELATHTYSHPFFWAEVGQHKASGKYNLAIPGYSFTAEREIAGSIDFINRNLAPADKKVKVVLWSGDAFPTEQDLAVSNRLGIINMNGGYTAIARDRPTVTLVSPMARPVGAQLQVYAPIMNENVYTDDWRGPFDGFRDVIDTFKMTDQPRRLKPINVYYHFYSGTKKSALRALQEVYEWSTAQDIFPVHVSDYASKVPEFRRVGVARYLDGRWKLSRLNNIRSLRMLGEKRYPQFKGSQGLAGARTLHDGIYIHTDGSREVSFKTTALPSNVPHLVSSNGRVQHWRATNAGLAFRISGEVPVSVALGGALASSCALSTDAGMLRGESQSDGSLRFTFSQKDTGNVILNCPA